jgi:hypothetical protein
VSYGQLGKHNPVIFSPSGADTVEHDDLTALPHRKEWISPMPKPALVPPTHDGLTRERRTNRRLRTLLNELYEGVRANRHDLNVQFTRLAQLQAEVDALKIHQASS